MASLIAKRTVLNNGMTTVGVSRASSLAASPSRLLDLIIAGALCCYAFSGCGGNSPQLSDHQIEVRIMAEDGCALRCGCVYEEVLQGEDPETVVPIGAPWVIDHPILNINETEAMAEGMRRRMQPEEFQQTADQRPQSVSLGGINTILTQRLAEEPTIKFPNRDKAWEMLKRYQPTNKEMRVLRDMVKGNKFSYQDVKGKTWTYSFGEIKVGDSPSQHVDGSCNVVLNGKACDAMVFFQNGLLLIAIDEQVFNRQETLVVEVYNKILSVAIGNEVDDTGSLTNTPSWGGPNYIMTKTTLREEAKKEEPVKQAEKTTSKAEKAIDSPEINTSGREITPGQDEIIMSGGASPARMLGLKGHAFSLDQDDFKKKQSVVNQKDARTRAKPVRLRQLPFKDLKFTQAFTEDGEPFMKGSVKLPNNEVVDVDVKNAGRRGNTQDISINLVGNDGKKREYLFSETSVSPNLASNDPVLSKQHYIFTIQELGVGQGEPALLMKSRDYAVKGLGGTFGSDKVRAFNLNFKEGNGTLIASNGKSFSVAQIEVVDDDKIRFKLKENGQSWQFEKTPKTKDSPSVFLLTQLDPKTNEPLPGKEGMELSIVSSPRGNGRF